MNKKILTIVIILAFTATAVFLSVREVRKQEKEQRISQEIVQKERKVEEKNDKELEELELEEIDTSNWKTYRNEEYGFEVKYPEGWEIVGDEKPSDKAKEQGFIRTFFLLQKERICLMSNNMHIDYDTNGIIKISIYNIDKRKNKLDKECNLEIIDYLKFNNTIEPLKACRYYRQLDMCGHNYFIVNNRHDDSLLYQLAIEIKNDNIDKSFSDKIGHKTGVFPKLTNEEIKKVSDIFSEIDKQTILGREMIESFKFIDNKKSVF